MGHRARLTFASLLLTGALSPLAIPQTASADSSGGLLVTVSPTRIANTANGTGGLGSTPFAAGETRSMIVTGTGGVPSSGVAAVVLEVVGSNATTAGSLSLYSDSVALPGTTDLSYPVTKASSDFAIVALGSDGGIKVTSLVGNPDVSLTVEGYFTASGSGGPGAGGFVPVTETRIFDDSATPLAAGATVQLQVSGQNGVPGGAKSVFVNATATTVNGGSGGITIWPIEQSQPSTSTLRWNSGVSSSGATFALGSSGKIYISNTGTQPIIVTLDLDGYFNSGVSAEGAAFVPVEDRIFDSGASGSQPLSGGQTMTVQVSAAAADLPDAYQFVATVLNVSVRNTSASGTLRVWASGSSEPITSDLSYDTSDNASALTFTKLGATGAVSIHNTGASAVDLTVDVQGWFRTPGTDSGATGGGTLAQDMTSSPEDESATAEKEALWDAYDAYLSGTMSWVDFSTLEATTADKWGWTPQVKQLSCPPPDCPPPSERILAVTQRGQTENFYCGPASGMVAIDYLNVGPSANDGSTLSQLHLANKNHMRTDQNGATHWYTRYWTWGVNQWIHHHNTGFYSQHARATGFAVQGFKKALRYDIDEFHPFGVSTVETSPEDTYNGHQYGSHQLIGHWITAYGYSNSTGTVYFADPATTVWSTVAPYFHSPSTAFFPKYIDNGISA
jgi:Peptidase_C39 like family